MDQSGTKKSQKKMKKRVAKPTRVCYDIKALKNRFSDPGGIAQLGERLNGIQEVSGSIPLISTKPKRTGGKSLISRQFFVYSISCGQNTELSGRTCNVYDIVLSPTSEPICGSRLGSTRFISGAHNFPATCGLQLQSPDREHAPGSADPLLLSTVRWTPAQPAKTLAVH